jgi:NAD(P)-dependent dehydrogenase (short-subunit alcohol dehydrogenase family)
MTGGLGAVQKLRLPVTGASSGIGLDVARRLPATGYRVVANSRNITPAMTLQTTDHMKLVDGDIGMKTTAERVAETAMQNFGRVDLLVNNDSIFIPKPFTEYTSEDFPRMTETNLPGFFLCIVASADSCASPEVRTCGQHRRVSRGEK